MANFLVLRKTFEIGADDGPKMLVGRQNRNIPDDMHSVVTTMRKHYNISVDVSFDSDGGTACDGMTYVIGDTYKNLPVPKKAQHIFSGWATAAGQILTDSSLVELSNTTLTAQWEYVDIGDDCTEYIVSCNSSYKNTGIYAANRYSSTSAVYVDWGDGNVEKINGNISKLSHSYANAGIYSVKISNNLTSFAPSRNDSTWCNTTSQNRYTFKSMVKTGSNMPIASNATMPSYAFYQCQALSSIDWLSSCYTGLTALPSYAFYYCQGITSLSSLPSRIKGLGSFAFYYCTGLTGIQDLRNTGLIGLYNESIFQYCTNVNEWKLPSTLTGSYFGVNVFANNSALSAIQLPESLTAIKDGCFIGDTQLKNISIPAKVVVVNTKAFYGCQTLSSIDWQTTALTSVQDYAFADCYALRDLNIPDTTKFIGNYAFQNCRAAQASALALPSSLTSVGSYAYKGCYSLKTLDIPSSLTILNDYAFAGCYSLSSIVDRRLTAQTIYTNTFGNTASNNSSTGYTGYATHGSNILCTYAAATGYDDGYWNDPLQEPTKCGFNIQYIDPENLRYCTISFDAGEGSVSETSRQLIYGRKIGELPEPTCPTDKPYFGGWYTEAGGAGMKYSADSTVPSQDSLTLYAFYSAVQLKSYTVDLNAQWRQSTIQNPDSSIYDGVYESNSNYNVSNGFAKMYVRISGYDEFTIYIRSYAESNYDYTLAFNPDVDVTSNPSYTTSGVKAHTRGNQQSGQTIEYYKKVTYTGLGGGDHFICIVYRKDGSVNNGDDRGYVLIPKDQ